MDLSADGAGGGGGGGGSFAFGAAQPASMETATDRAELPAMGSAAASDEIETMGSGMNRPRLVFETRVPENSASLVEAQKIKKLTEFNSRGVPADQVSTMSFEDLRAGYVERYRGASHIDCNALAACKTPDELLATLNSRKTRPMTQGEANHASRFRTQLLADGKLEEFRNSIVGKYTIIDPATGQEIIANTNDPVHRELLLEKFAANNVVKVTSHTRNARILNQVAMAEGPAMALIGDELLKHGEAGTDESQRRMQMLMERQIALMHDAQKKLNNLVTLEPDEAVFVQIKANEVEFADTAVRFFPLQEGIMNYAQAEYHKNLMNALIFWNAYPTILFESKLRLLLFGKRTYRTASTYGYQSMQALYHWALKTNLKMRHEEFLEAEEKVCRDLQAMALSEREALASYEDPAEREVRERSVNGTMAEVAFMARSIAEARSAYIANGDVVSPFEKYLSRPSELGGPWKRSHFPRHSHAEIIKAVDGIRVRVDNGFSVQLDRLESRYRVEAGTGDVVPNGQNFRDFMREFWMLNHTFTVESLQAFDIGITLLYEEAIPPQNRHDMVIKSDVVMKGVAHKEVVQQCLKERVFYTRLRSYCRHYAAQKVETILLNSGHATADADSLFRSNGLRFHSAEVVQCAADEVEPAQAASPTFLELYEFYKHVTTDYTDPQYLEYAIDGMDCVLSHIYDEQTGALKDDYEEIIDALFDAKALPERKRTKVDGAQTTTTTTTAETGTVRVVGGMRMTVTEQAAIVEDE